MPTKVMTYNLNQDESEAKNVSDSKSKQSNIDNLIWLFDVEWNFYLSKHVVRLLKLGSTRKEI